MKQMSVKLTINADGNVQGVARDINNDLKTSDNLCQQIS